MVIRRNTINLLKKRLLHLCIFIASSYVLYRFGMYILFQQEVPPSERDIIRSQIDAQFQMTDSVNLPAQFGTDLLHVQACKHPELRMDDPNIMKFFQTTPKITCASEQDWVCVNNGVAQSCQGTTRDPNQVECEYVYLQRVSGDFGFADGETVQSKTLIHQLKDDFFKVFCTEKKTGDQWHNIMAAVVRKPEVVDRTGFSKIASDGLPLNVVILAFDSLSRLTFMRKLPKTYKYLTDTLDTVVLKGYNIVGDGTPQALIPMLTGHTELELPETRKRMPNPKFVNSYPFIWNQFRDNGYVTMYNEDSPHIGTFTYRLTGFDEQPTDHYMRPFYLAAMPRYYQHRPLCLGSCARHQVFLDYAKQFMSVYKDKPKFFFGFHSELSHDDFNRIGAADDDALATLQWMSSGGHLNNTLLIVGSDHGHRFAEFRELQQGKQEERLPFFSLYVPAWFREKHPKAFANLRVNSERLTTPFDVYETLKSVLHFDESAVREKGSVAKRGINLFQEVPIERTCRMAHIETHWCACLKWETVAPDDDAAKRAANHLVNFINDGVIGEERRDLCARLQLKEITWALSYVPNDGLLKFKQSADKDGLLADLTDNTKVSNVLYQIKIVTEPGGGHFEASLKFSVDEGKWSVTDQSISRTNRYGTQAACVEDNLEHLRKYCYCNNQSRTSGR